MITEIAVGDTVRVGSRIDSWRVIERDEKTGMLVLVSLNRADRIVWSGVYEFRVVKSGVFV